MKTHSTEAAISELLNSAGITVNGSKPYDMQVHDARLYGRLLAETSLAMGETYVDGWWDCDALDECVARILSAKLRERVKGNWRIAGYALKSKILNLQHAKRAFEVGEKHYDIGNDLYAPMLGNTMAYTCAYWKHAQTLDEAQEAKLDLVCRKVGLAPGMKVLELGCGWGSFAKYAAETYGVEVTGVTVSKEQVKLGMERCKGLPVKILLDDYRNAKGEFDVVLSIGILEHVGYKNYRSYMEVAHRCLTKDGVAFIHTIGGNRSVTTMEPWLGKYIFPNAIIPSVAQIAKAMEGLFVMEDLQNIGPDYDATLMRWYDNFLAAWPHLRQKYGERFFRMWRYYLLSCAGSFRCRYDQLWQIVMTKLRVPQPECRFS
jgi:cyclopropane-fatty-acyl-phospholipid synthase